MDFKRSLPRKAMTFLVPSGTRDSILEEVQNKFKDVQFSKGAGETIIVSLTGSHIYDAQVSNSLFQLGAEAQP